MRFYRTKVLKILCLLSTFVLLRLLYLTIGVDHSLKQRHLLMEDFPDQFGTGKTSERRILRSIVKAGVKAKILEENNAHFIISVQKKKVLSSDVNNDHQDPDPDPENKHARKDDEKTDRESYEQIDKQTTKTNEHTDENVERTNEEHVLKQDSVPQPPFNCPRNSLYHDSKSSRARTSYGRCRPHQSSKEDCVTADETFTLKPALQHCDNKTASICEFQTVQTKGQKTVQVTCDKRRCKEIKDGITVKGLDSDSGEHVVLQSCSTLKEVEKYLPDVIHDHEYVFLECSGHDGNHTEQLLVIPPVYKLQENKDKRRLSNAININIILIDSVARAHFYRSLPNTIQLFKNWTKNRHQSPAEVLDFELFQSVEGHTAENLHALFTGTLFPADRPRDEDYPSVGLETLFGHFEKNNYQTMWQEDLCWEGIWGLLTDLAIGSDWQSLGPTLKEVHIHRTGITHSSCPVLKNYDLFSPFNGPSSNKICYNGIFQHNYFLQYVLDTMKAIQSAPRALPMLSYLALNVGHDQDGLRIQTLDNDFVNYCKQFAALDNTLTIILADHGNTYTDYTVSTLEGRFEMFHPSLFAIVPNNVAKVLGKRAMSALRTNQRRLVTMIDLHHTLMSLVKPSKGPMQRKGLFKAVSSNRTCNEIDLRTPNLCVCDGWDSPTVNDTARIALAEYAVGQLNNKIQNSLAKNALIPMMSSCVRLKPIQFVNVRERNTAQGEGLVTSFDIIIPAGNAVAHDQDVFRVEVKSSLTPSDSSQYKLIHYERLSMFGKYKKCSNKNVNLKLCVCNAKSTQQQQQKLQQQRFPISAEEIKALLIQTTAGFFHSKVLAKSIGSEKCIYVIKRVHGKDTAFAVEVANVCLDMSRDVLLSVLDSNNIKFSVDFPLLVSVPAGGITFAFSAAKHIDDYKASFDISAIVVNVVRDS